MSLPIATYFVAGLVLIVVSVGLLSVSSRRAWAARTEELDSFPVHLDADYVRDKRFVRRHRGVPPDRVADHLSKIADEMAVGGSCDVARPSFGSARRGWDARQVAHLLDVVESTGDRHG